MYIGFWEAMVILMLSPVLLVIGTVMLVLFLVAVGGMAGLIHASFNYGQVAVSDWWKNRAKA